MKLIYTVLAVLIVAALVLYFYSAPQEQTLHPISVVSVQSGCFGGMCNPGGPSVKVTLKDSSNIPVTKLSATLLIFGSGDPQSGRRAFNFDISQSNPLMPGQTTSQTLIFIGGGWSSESTYPLQIEGTLQNGQTFNYTANVRITEP